MRLAYRLNIIPVFSLLVLVSILSVSIYFYLNNKKNLTAIEEGYFPLVTYGYKLEDEIQTIKRGFQDAAQAGDAEQLIALDDRYEQVLAEIEVNLNNIHAKKDQLTEIQELFKKYYSVARGLANDFITGNFSGDFTDRAQRQTQLVQDLNEKIENLNEQYYSLMNQGFNSTKNSQLFATIFIAILTGLTLFALILGFFFGAQISRNVRRLLSRLKDIAMGEGDLTQRIAVKTSSELGDLAKTFNLFLEKLNEMVAKTQESVGVTGSINQKLSAWKDNNHLLLDEVNKNLNKSEALITETHSTAEQVSQLSKNQEEHTADINKTVQNIGTEIERLTDVVQSQSNSISELGAAINQQAANIENIHTISRNASGAAESLSRISSEGKSTLGRTSENVQSMLNLFDTVSNFANTIVEIASKTNLLAMNAAIEAAHAGEHGKGFAVVAEEIRKLADNSNQEAEGAKRLLSEVGESAQNLTDELNQTVSRFDEVVGETSIVSESIEQVTNAMGEQRVANTEMVREMESIRQNTSDLNEVSQHLSEASISVGEKTTGIVEINSNATGQITGLIGISKSLANEVNNILEKLREIQTSASDVSELINLSSEQSEGLNALVHQYKTDQNLLDEPESF